MMSVFASRTIGDVVAEILMSRSAFAGSLLILEGDDDIRFWRPRSRGHRECQFVLAGSKSTVLGAIAALEVKNQTGILGVIDDDCDSLLGIPLPSANVVRTETRDIETLLLFNNSFEKVLGEAGDLNKIEALEQREGVCIRDAFISRAVIFGQLRFLNSRNNWTVAFDRLSPWKWADIPSWTFNRTALIQAACDQIPQMTEDMLEAEIAQLHRYSPLSILHGKDCLDVLAIGLRSVIGNHQYSDKRIMQMLRLAFDKTMLRDTRLYSNIKGWETSNPGYKVLIDD